MEVVQSFVFHGALVIHIGLLAACVGRVWRGQTPIDRLIAADVLGLLMLAVVVLISLITGESLYIDVALGMAAVGFIGTMALARYIADQQVF
jgi:multisubunit Na+/H+ antiporter MnhF subunit